MTHEILESDIELAKSLLRGGHTDSEILVLLNRRGLDPAVSARLVKDLRQGRPVAHPMPVVTGWTGGSNDPAPAAEVEAQRPARREERATRDRSRGAGGPGFLALVLVGLGGGVVGLLISPYLHRGASPAASLLPTTANAASKIPAGSGAETGTSEGRPRSVAACELQIAADGVLACRSPVTRESVLRVISGCLGPATRTNRVAGGQVVYAYDSQGVLVYAQPGGEKSLVVDFLGRGGEHGSKTPFTGALRIGSTTIEAGTGPKQLAAIERLELNDAGTEGGLFGGKYAEVELFFAYRGTSDRLQLVQIDLK